MWSGTGWLTCKTPHAWSKTRSQWTVRKPFRSRRSATCQKTNPGLITESVVVATGANSSGSALATDEGAELTSDETIALVVGCVNGKRHAEQFTHQESPSDCSDASPLLVTFNPCRMALFALVSLPLQLVLKPSPVSIHNSHAFTLGSLDWQRINAALDRFERRAMDSHCVGAPTTGADGSTTGERPSHAGWYPFRPVHRLSLGGHAGPLRLLCDLLAAAQSMEGRGDLDEYTRHAASVLRGL